MKKLLFVFNPHSGKEQIKNYLLGIIKIFSEADYEVTVYPTRAEKDGYRYILENINRYDMLVCSGGDGTLNETVNAIIESGRTDIAVGYIPSGTTNDFATSLGIPKNMTTAAEHIVSGEPVACDVGIINGERYFNYVAAFGAFTAVSYATPQYLKNALGHPAYLLEAAKSITTLKPYSIKLKADNSYAQGKYVYGMISNTKSVGGIKGLAGNHVNLQDGLFEVTLVKQIKTLAEIQQLMTAFLTQKYQECDMILSVKAKHIEIESDDPVSWTLDGEFGGEHKKAVFDVLDSTVRYIIKKRKYKNF